MRCSDMKEQGLSWIVQYLHEEMIMSIRRLFSDFSLCVVLVAVFSGCTGSPIERETVLYERLKASIDSIKVVNTHEHQQMLKAVNFYTIAGRSYLNWNLEGLDWDLINAGKLDEQWEKCGQSLNYNSATTFYDQLRRGFKLLYGFNDPYFTRENIRLLSADIAENYSRFDQWYGEAFTKAGFDIMLLDQWWNTFNMDIDTRYFALVFRINTLVMAISGAPENIHFASAEFYELAGKNGFSIKTLDDYLSFSDFLLQKHLEHDVVALKNSLAYDRTLYYEYIPYEKAKAVFAIPVGKRSDEQKKMLEDFMFHWIIEKSIEYDLPVQIHTGYGPYTLEDGRPSNLNNLFIRYPKAKFILFHGGYPWTGEFIALGKRFNNVYLDLVWLPQISRERSIQVLDEMLDCVPFNRIFWGGDCHFIEESAGSLEIARDVVARVCAKRIDRGLMTEDTARTVARSIFRDNAIEVFKLREKLKREF